MLQIVTRMHEMLSNWVRVLHLLVTALVLADMVLPSNAKCLSTEDWEPIPEDQYDRTYSEINVADARPLGYKVGTYNYNAGKSVCVKVLGTSLRRVEVKIETQPAAKLCVKAVDDDTENCVDSKTLGLCENFVTSPENSTTFEFYCTGECSESDVSFWYRFTVCPYTTYDENEIWCQNVQDDYPSTLQVVPPNFFPITTAAPVGQGTTFVSSLSLISTLLIGYLCFG